MGEAKTHSGSSSFSDDEESDISLEAPGEDAPLSEQLEYERRKHAEARAVISSLISKVDEYETLLLSELKRERQNYLKRIDTLNEELENEKGHTLSVLAELQHDIEEIEEENQHLARELEAKDSRLNQLGAVFLQARQLIFGDDPAATLTAAQAELLGAQQRVFEQERAHLLSQLLAEKEAHARTLEHIDNHGNDASDLEKELRLERDRSQQKEQMIQNLVQRMKDVIAAHSQTLNQFEALKDQHATLEHELNELKSQPENADSPTRAKSPRPQSQQASPTQAQSAATPISKSLSFGGVDFEPNSPHSPHSPPSPVAVDPALELPRNRGSTIRSRVSEGRPATSLAMRTLRFKLANAGRAANPFQEAQPIPGASSSKFYDKQLEVLESAPVFVEEFGEKVWVSRNKSSLMIYDKNTFESHHVSCKDRDDTMICILNVANKTMWCASKRLRVIYIYNPKTFKIIGETPANEQPYTSMIYVPERKHVWAIARYGRSVHVWDSSSFKLRKEITIQRPQGARLLHSITYVKSSHRVWLAHDAGVSSFDSKSGKEVSEIANNISVSQLVYSAVADRVWGCSETSLVVWDSSGVLLKKIECNSLVYCLLASENAQIWASTLDRRLLIYDSSSLSIIDTIADAHDEAITGLALVTRKNDKQVWSVSLDCRIKLWNTGDPLEANAEESAQPSTPTASSVFFKFRRKERDPNRSRTVLKSFEESRGSPGSQMIGGVKTPQATPQSTPIGSPVVGGAPCLEHRLKKLGKRDMKNSICSVCHQSITSKGLYCTICSITIHRTCDDGRAVRSPSIPASNINSPIIGSPSISTPKSTLKSMPRSSEERLRVLFVGPAESGKTTMQRLLRGEANLTPNYESTTSIMHTPIKFPGSKDVELVDTPGISPSQWSSEMVANIRAADCIVLPFDVGSRASFNEMQETLERVVTIKGWEEHEEKRLPVVIVGSVFGKHKRRITNERSQAHADVTNTLYYEWNPDDPDFRSKFMSVCAECLKINK
jgi:hypothetical protein